MYLTKEFKHAIFFPGEFPDLLHFRILSFTTALRNYFFLSSDQNYSIPQFDVQPLQFSQLGVIITQ
jgi:hypothetical protein